MEKLFCPVRKDRASSADVKDLTTAPSVQVRGMHVWVSRTDCVLVPGNLPKAIVPIGVDPRAKSCLYGIVLCFTRSFTLQTRCGALRSVVIRGGRWCGHWTR